MILSRFFCSRCPRTRGLPTAPGSLCIQVSGSARCRSCCDGPFGSGVKLVLLDQCHAVQLSSGGVPRCKMMEKHPFQLAVLLPALL